MWIGKSPGLVLLRPPHMHDGSLWEEKLRISDDTTRERVPRINGATPVHKCPMTPDRPPHMGGRAHAQVHSPRVAAKSGARAAMVCALGSARACVRGALCGEASSVR